MNLLRIKLENGKPTYKHEEVILGTIQTAILAGKGEGASVLIHAEHLKYKLAE